MNLEAILGDDANLRAAALADAAAAPEHLRSAFASKLAIVARDAAGALAAADEAGLNTAPLVPELERVCVALSLLGVAAAKSCLYRIADEGTPAVKTALARALTRTKTPGGRAVLVHLLSDDDARAPALRAIEEAPWPEVLQQLIEIAEADDKSVRLTLFAIAKCGATAGPDETNAAADFLIEQLDDDGVLLVAVDALLRFGMGFPGVTQRARLLAKEPGKRKIAGLCLIAAFSDEGSAGLLELALSGHKADEGLARAFLGPLLADPDPRINEAATRTWKALDLR
jgi:hypothetical protein